jgi:membrane-bound lytic murein transglycosylase B
VRLYLSDELHGNLKLRLGALLLVAAALAALLPAASVSAAQLDERGDRAPIAYRHLLRLQRDEARIAAARADQAALAAQPAADDYLARMVQGLEADNAAYRYREAIRAEQYDLLQIAIVPDLAQQVIAVSPPALATSERYTFDAWYSMWRLAGIDEFNLVRIHPHPVDGAQPSATLTRYYQSAASHYQLDWTYLASINFIESDFGRVNGPSSAGALGPMQFMPGTWKDYGSGDIMSPKDSIEAAARYLRAMGGPGNMDRAIYRYNNDTDYVASVKGFARAIREDGGWLDRLYYWSTTG